jgi:hypothetical protein
MLYFWGRQNQLLLDLEEMEAQAGLLELELEQLVPVEAQVHLDFGRMPITEQEVEEERQI